MKKSYIIAFWSPFYIPNMHFYTDFFSMFMEKYGDFQCLDFKCRRDSKTMRFLMEADLVVVGLSKNKDIMSSYFCYMPKPFKQIRYIITEYFPIDEEYLDSLCGQYRIPPSELAKIPYNARFQESIKSGRGAEYLKSPRTGRQYENAINFRGELDRCAKLFLKALEN